jgi:shikimate kinase
VDAETGFPHLVFVGLAGSGKTTIGRGVAERLGREFIDLDQEILRREDRATVGEVFRAHGEAYFRQIESAITEELSRKTSLVIAPGGGWIMTPRSVEMMRRVSYLIYLKVSPETALERIGADVGNRPLLDHPDPLGELRRMLEVRGPKYEDADLIVDADKAPAGELIDQLILRIRPS